MRVALLIANYNEIEGMKVILPRIRKDWVDEILVVDGGSIDGSIEYAKECGFNVLNQKGRGLLCGYVEALDHIKADAVITFSPDGNSIPEIVPSIVAKMREGYDMVIASRYIGGAKSDDDDFLTAFGNKMFTFLINLLYGSSYTDTLVMYRGWKKEAFKEMGIGKHITFSEKYFYLRAGAEPLLCIRAAKRKLKCIDIPGDEPARIGGCRKLQIFVGGFSILFLTIRELFVRKWAK
ncbi:MAG: glycosyltransferase family 2 protein [Kiritimatiellae bacterium]|nr:glycosyltransferase family 2 protein [Kiritimatiellia bacterium]MDD5521309.1 glycosyltransferase family 2 protein [Kiritimatiellia bacterium]